MKRERERGGGGSKRPWAKFLKGEVV